MAFRTELQHIKQSEVSHVCSAVIADSSVVKGTLHALFEINTNDDFPLTRLWGSFDRVGFDLMCS